MTAQFTVCTWLDNVCLVYVTVLVPVNGSMRFMASKPVEGFKF